MAGQSQSGHLCQRSISVTEYQNIVHKIRGRSEEEKSGGYKINTSHAATVLNKSPLCKLNLAWLGIQISLSSTI